MTKQNLRLPAVMVGLAGLVLLTYREDLLGPPLAHWTAWTTRVTLALLHWSGMEASRGANLITHPGGFAYEISYRCTGFLPVVFLTTAILAYRGSLRRKIIGLAVGIPILIALNLTRLVHLFYLGVHQPAAFDFAHGILWEAFLILAVLGLWLAWIPRSNDSPTPIPYRDCQG
jgi:exosortase H (IPTLxxWG-CTERM-specific)